MRILYLGHLGGARRYSDTKVVRSKDSAFIIAKTLNDIYLFCLLITDKRCRMDDQSEDEVVKHPALATKKTTPVIQF